MIVVSCMKFNMSSTTSDQAQENYDTSANNLERQIYL